MEGEGRESPGDYTYLGELANAYCREDGEPCDHCLDRAKWDMDAAASHGFQMVPLGLHVVPRAGPERPGSMAGVYDQE